MIYAYRTQDIASCKTLLYVLSSVAIILKRKRKLVALLLLSYRCFVTINVLWLFLAVPWVGLQCVIVVFPDHTHLLFVVNSFMENSIGLKRVNNTYFKFFLQFFDLFLFVGALFFQVITLDLCILQLCHHCFMFISEKKMFKNSP